MSKYKKIDISKIRTIKVSDRLTKADVHKSGKSIDPKASLAEFFDSLPDYLKSADLKKLASLIVAAKINKKPIVWMTGAHPLKVGLSPVINDLIELGFIDHIAFNGAGAIHDIEMAFFGRTSEEVGAGLADGTFGMVEETPSLIFSAVKNADSENLGLGEGLGKFIKENSPQYKDFSVIHKCYEKNIPLTVHMAIGTDTICQHKEFDGALMGKLSHHDFLIFCQTISGLSGGVILNIGSSVILPEVFLKALTVARNINGKIDNFAAANFDMIQHYRPNTNVVQRPVAGNGIGFSFTGHHELMIPLLAAAIKTNFMKISKKE